MVGKKRTNRQFNLELLSRMVFFFCQELPTLIFDTFAIKRLVKEYVMVRIVDQKFLKSSDNVLGNKKSCRRQNKKHFYGADA
jgi:hypothetical protein